MDEQNQRPNAKSLKAEFDKGLTIDIALGR
jgi:hypothetical protein